MPAGPFEASLISTTARAHLFRSGITVRAVAAQLGIARSSAGRLRQKAQEDGLRDSEEESEAGGGEDESGTLSRVPRLA